jgi:hypothetical protein
MRRRLPITTDTAELIGTWQHRVRQRAENRTFGSSVIFGVFLQLVGDCENYVCQYEQQHADDQPQWVLKHMTLVKHEG